MRRVITATILATFVALLGLTPTIASAAGTAQEGTEITFRSAPAGLVVPSLFVAGNEAQWVLDPAENEPIQAVDGVAGCQLTVTDRNGNGAVDGVDVLDRSTEAGCIDSWSARGEANCAANDVFVAEIDGLAEVYPATFWIVHRNGETANVGVCDLALQDGESLTFVYE